MWRIHVDTCSQHRYDCTGNHHPHSARSGTRCSSLVSTLSGETEYTVFAPSDEAFAAAGIDLDTFDTDEEIAALADILLYHVVAGTTLSTDLAAGANTVTAANGDELTITVSETGVAVGADGAVVTLADVPASNGVIHVIDKVLTPPADDPFEGVDCAVTIGPVSYTHLTLPTKRIV